MGYLGTQKELGYKGNWDVWGRKYTLLGLLDCYARTGDVKDLAAAQAVADHLMRELPADGKPCIVDVGQWNGMAASSIIEPLVKLYFATGEKKYLDYAASIPASWETEGGPKLISKAMAGMPVYDMFPGPVANPQGYGDYGKSKSYEMMSCYDGLIELYRAAGKAEYLEPVKTVGSKEAAPAQCDMHQNCCVANGPRGMLMIPKLAVMRGREGPVVNLYGTMQATVQSPGGQDLKWEMYSDYPIGGAVTLKLNVKQPEKFTLKLRVPTWSEATLIKVNDQPMPKATAGTHAAIERTWQDGDGVTIVFDMAARVVHDAQVPGYVAIMRGPLVFVRDQRLAEGSIDAAVSPAADEQGRLAGATLTEPGGDAFWLTLTVPQKDGPPLKLCDMISAGNTWTEASTYRVWLPAR